MRRTRSASSGVTSPQSVVGEDDGIAAIQRGADSSGEGATRPVGQRRAALAIDAHDLLLGGMNAACQDAGLDRESGSCARDR